MIGEWFDSTVANIAGHLLTAMVSNDRSVDGDYYDNRDVERAVKLARMVVEETKRTNPQVPTFVEINPR